MILIDGKEWRPISFVDLLIEAILADLKGETRRIAKVPSHWSFPNPARYIDGFIYRWGPAAANDAKPERIACPYGKAGDFLWVRESFATFRLIDSGSDIPWMVYPSKIDEADFVVFKDGSIVWRPEKADIQVSKLSAKMLMDVARIASAMVGDCKFRPPMHLPFWAHRIELEVKSIKVEGLQEITEAGAVAEGFQEKDVAPFEFLKLPAREQFISKWDEINGKRLDKNSGKPLTWESNPLVWVVNFKRIK